MRAEGVGERGGRGLRRPGPPAVIVPLLRLPGEGVASAEEHGQGLRLRCVQRDSDQRGPELVDTVPGQAVSGERLVQRRARHLTPQAAQAVVATLTARPGAAPRGKRRGLGSGFKGTAAW
ncbi:hypothetical protein [Streptomyces kanasensis]|uniref:Uncharacterized protein n=1 Tax=Streptomyces kanasensis TaxID=936756 RepID=A0A100Y1T9_9ACTN|nr:hypothetical protein [Streptomyces kanasensis]KUH36131.1 hypothetical protein ATE80_25455 [Streptomyces kanasensis]